jgi:ABC-type transport system involved in cytochrome bd biosynthesis fused ATPase/permease subunit
MTEIEKIVLGLLFLVMLFLSVILLPIDIQDFRKSTEYKDSKFRIKGLKILTSRTYGNSIVMVFFSIVGIALLAYNYHIKFGYHYDDMALLGVAFVGILVCSIWKTVVDIRNYWKKKKEINPSKKCELL